MATNNTDGSTPSIPIPDAPSASNEPKAQATPSAKKPAAKKPAAKKPTAAKTDAVKPTAAKTDAVKPATAKTAAAKPAAAKTSAAKAAATPAAPAAPAAPPVPPAAPAAVPAASTDPYSAPSGTPVAGYESTPTPGQAPFTPVPAGPAQGLSIASMVTGISGILLSFVAFGFLPGVAAVVMGHMAQKKQPQARPYWLTGLITGYVSVGIAVLTVIFVLGFIAVVFSSFGEIGPGYRNNF